jgi:tetratricopeptide (TPR) repeat protein
MTTVPEAMALVASLHQAGREREAEQVCRQVVEACPSHADAWNYLGVLAFQAGQKTVAIECFSKAAAIDPQYAEAHNNLGNALRQQDDLERAAACYEQALQIRPDFAEAHYNLGLTRHQEMRWQEAAMHYRRAAAIAPDSPHVYLNLGSALKSLGDLNGAIGCYRRLIALTPDSGAAHVALATALCESGAIKEAILCFQRALSLNSNSADACNGLGTALEALGDLDGAIDCFQRAIRSSPNCIAAINNLGLALQAQGHFEDALDVHRRALELNPHSPELHNNLGTALKELKRLDESRACYQRALDLKPDYAYALSNLGTALKDQWKLDDAITCYARALAIHPWRPEFHTNLGLALQEQQRLEEAAACFQRAIELDPDYAEAHFALGSLALLQGDFANGWPKYEWRWRRPGNRPRSLAAEPWEGGSLTGKTILLHAEQGLGDTIQFVRFVPMIKQRAARVLLECQEPLLPLLKGMQIDGLLKRGGSLPVFEVHAPLLSLPYLLKLNMEDVVASVPYLHVTPEVAQGAQDALQSLSGFKVGIAWQGNPTFSGDLRRSIPLQHYRAIAQVPGVKLISLQKGAGADQIQNVERQFEVVQLQGQWSEAIRTFEQTAAIIMSLDLVISSDTSIAHLAGALGVPVWVAVSFMPDWRWLLDRRDSPWYPTMRLFRQPMPGDWDGAFSEMTNALRDELQRKR